MNFSKESPVNDNTAQSEDSASGYASDSGFFPPSASRTSSSFESKFEDIPMREEGGVELGSTPMANTKKTVGVSRHVLNKKFDRKKKVKQHSNNAVNRTAYRANLVNASLAAAESEAAGFKDALKEMKRDVSSESKKSFDSVGLDASGESDNMIVISYQRFEVGINTRNVVLNWREDLTVDVYGYIGNWKLGKTDFVLVGHYMPLLSTDDVVDASSDGLFYLVRRREYARPDVWIRPRMVYDKQGIGYQLLGNSLDNLRYSVYRCVHTYVTAKLAMDRNALIWEAQRQYTARYGDMANMKGELMRLVEESWVGEQLTAFLRRKEQQRPEAFNNLALAIVSNRYPRKPTIWRWLSQGLMRTAVGTGVAATVFLGMSMFTNLKNTGKLVSSLAIGSAVVGGIYKTLGGPRQADLDVVNGVQPISIHKNVAPIYDPVYEVVKSVRLGEVPLLVPACARSFPRSVIKNRTYPPLEPTATITVPEVKTEVEPKKTENYGVMIDGTPLVIPEPCDQNLEAALRIRMAFERPKDQRALADFKSFCIEQIDAMDPIHVENIDNETFIRKQYPPKRANAILAAGGDLNDEDVWSELFVKLESYMGKDSDNFKPRMIWSRSLKVLFHFARYFHQIGNEMKKRFNKEAAEYYVSGATPTDVGAAAKLMEELSYFYEMDVSNWDGSLNRVFLEIELYFLKNKIHGMPPETKWLEDNWFNVWGKTRTGLKYQADYGRRSGDLWTSIFNSFLNFMLLRYVSFKLVEPQMQNVKQAVGSTSHHVAESTCGFVSVLKTGGLPHRAMVLGDDSVFASPVKLDANQVIEIYRNLGMKVEVIEHTDMADVGFCSGIFWRHGGTYRWGNLPFKQMAKFGMNYGNHPESIHKRLLFGMAKGMLCTAGHIPIIGTLLRRICETAENAGIKPYYDNRYLNPGRIGGGTTHYPLSDTYQHFCDRYGFDILSVELFENILEKEVSIDMFPFTSFDEVFKRCISIDVPSESEPAEVELDTYKKYAVEKAPLCEEVYKLSLARSIGILAAADHFADHEIKTQGSPTYVKTLHRLFTCVSSWNLTAGVMLHTWWNWLAVNFGASPCARKKKVKTVAVVPVVTTKKRRGKKRKSKKQPQMDITPFIAARVNPFHTAALGAKIPDTYVWPTSTLVLRNSITMSTPQSLFTTGFWLGCSPFPAHTFYVPASVTAGGVPTWAGGTTTTSTGYASFQTNAELYRIVGWGVRISGVASLSNCSGKIYVAHIPHNMDTDSGGVTYWPTTEAQMESSLVSRMFSMKEITDDSAVIVGRMVDDGCLRFRSANYPQNAAPYAEEDSGHCNVVMFCTGAPASTAMITVESWVHVEYVHYPGLSLFVDSQASPVDYKEMEMASKLCTLTPPACIEGDDWLESVDKTLNRVSSAVSKGLAMVGQANRVYNTAKRTIEMASNAYYGSRGRPLLSWTEEKY